MKKLSILFAILVLLLLPAFSVGAQDAPPEEDPPVCSLEVTSQDNNNVQVTVSLANMGNDWAHLGWPYDNGGTDTQNGSVVGISLAFEGGWQQTITMSVNGIQCDSAPVEINVWKPDDGNSNPGGGGYTVGNLALMGQGVDDCRFFIADSFNVVYTVDQNALVVTIQKMGENNRPFTAVVESLFGLVPWRVQSDPFLGGDNGWGSETYNLPYDQVLADTTVESVSVTVSNAITGVECASAEVPIR